MFFKIKEVRLGAVDQAKANAGALAAIYSAAKILLALFGIHLP